MIHFYNRFIYWLIDLVEDRTFGSTRDSRWVGVRRAFIALHPKCAVCGTKDNLECHHKMPFHLDASLELKESNLITLCRDHHLLVGHLMSFRSFNKDVEQDAKLLQDKIKNRP